MDINDPSVYTYYTIEPFVQQQNVADNIIYFTIGQTETTNDEDEPSSTGFEEMEAHDDLSSYKVLSVEDGGLYVTETETDTEVPMKQEIFSEESSMNYLENDDSVLIEEQDSNDTEYQTIQLKDGRHAIIEKTLWSSLLQNNCNEDGSKKQKKFPCMYDGCDKVYTTAQHLTVHERNHTGDRPYECPIEGCDKAFAAGYSLKAHVRTHTGEKPYSCVACIKQFKTSGDLQKHIRTHTGEKPFKCPVEGCNRSFTTSNIRKVHIRSHTGERPYVCPIENCGKAFASATNYKNHTRIHSGEKPYVCPVADCNKRFTEYSSLYKHNTVHKPFKPYKCSYCGQLCKIESTLKAHKRTMHGVIFTQDGSEILIDNEDYPDVVFEISSTKSTLQLKE